MAISTHGICRWTVINVRCRMLSRTSIASQNRVRNGQNSQQKFLNADYPNRVKGPITTLSTDENGYTKYRQEKIGNTGRRSRMFCGCFSQTSSPTRPASGFSMRNLAQQPSRHLPAWLFSHALLPAGSQRPGSSGAARASAHTTAALRLGAAALADFRRTIPD